LFGGNQGYFKRLVREGENAKQKQKKKMRPGTYMSVGKIQASWTEAAWGGSWGGVYAAAVVKGSKAKRTEGVGARSSGKKTHQTWAKG